MIENGKLSCYEYKCPTGKGIKPNYNIFKPSEIPVKIITAHKIRILKKRCIELFNISN